MRRLLPGLLGISLILFFTAVILNRSENASAAITTHVVISEVQIAGVSPTDEFIELYNPTESDVDLSTWRLGRKTPSGADANDLVASLSGTIKAHGYFLIASDSYMGTVSADIMYASASSSIASSNSVTLYDSLNAPVDLVGLGTSTASETATINNPSAGNSVERKANSLSDATSMGPGGGDEFAGNGEDSDNNAADFVSRSVPQPQNSASEIEPALVSPSPTVEPSPTTEPSPTESPTPTLTPTPSLSPTPSVPAPKIIAFGPIFTCSLNYKPWKFFGKTFYFPFISCSRTT